MSNSVNKIPKAVPAGLCHLHKIHYHSGIITSRTLNPFYAVLMLTYTPNFWSNLNKTSLYMVIILIRLVYLDNIKGGMNWAWWWFTSVMPSLRRWT